MNEPMAFLSYTRKDDEFFGGYVTAFRKTLEQAVHVVTGSETFRIFQDIEGLVIGEQWRKKLGEVVSSSSLFVPVVSPLFFSSGPCREETQVFLAHERGLCRDDLILPIYFITSARLEKEEEKKKDALAGELAKRQMYDWRDHANIPLQEPAARAAILALAQAVGSAIERLGEPTVGGPDDSAPGGRRHVATGAEPGPVPSEIAAAALTKREALSERRILWVDDNPAHNASERRALEPYGMQFVIATNTETALNEIRDSGPFAAVISDMARRGDAQAGYTLLERLGGQRTSTPYFIYSTSRAPQQVRQAVAKGAAGVTNDPDELVRMVVDAIR